MKDSRILTEWIDANGNKINLNSLNNSTATQQKNDLYKDRFMKLAKHIEDCHSWSTVLYVSEWELDLEFYYESEAYSLDIDVNSTNIQVIVYNNVSGAEIINATVRHNEWSKILSILKANNVIKDIKACESINLSTIDSFKLYENLWTEENLNESTSSL